MIIKKIPKVSRRELQTEYVIMRLFQNKPYKLKYSYNYKMGKLIKEKVLGKKISSLSTINLKNIANTLQILHTHKYHKFGRIAIDGFPRQKGNFKSAIIYYTELLKHNLDKVNLSNNQLDLIKQKIKLVVSKMDKYSSFNNTEFSLIHRDLHKGNILINNGKISLIDWGSAATWDPALDIALFFTKNNIAQNKQNLFLKEYIKDNKDHEIIDRVRLYIPLTIIANIIFNPCAHIEAEINKLR